MESNVLKAKSGAREPELLWGAIWQSGSSRASESL